MSSKSFFVPNEKDIAPYFQPIISVQTQNIIGYEALGRKINDHVIQSLGSFFKNPGIDDETHIKVDRFLREKAIQKLSLTTDGTMLFINLKPSWIYRHHKKHHKSDALQMLQIPGNITLPTVQIQENKALPTLQMLEKYNIPASKIVIEITEEEFTGNLEDLKEIIQVYRQEGCKIAIDDVGSGASNFDRIALIQPDILKIDLNILKKSSTHHGYKALLRSFSILSAQIGASLLIEGVETKHDIQHALDVGARYMQGYLFSPAVPEFLDPHIFNKMVKKEIDIFGNINYLKYEKMAQTEKSMNILLSSLESSSVMEDADDIIERLTPLIEGNCIRIYICLEDGSQVSSNHYFTSDGVWEKDSSFQKTNWIWRPYFIPNILLMKHHGRGILSHDYTDLDSSSTINTFSYPLDFGYFVFLDITIS